jgi:hypothetical protein
MALPVTIPNEFANATASIPLSQLDTNFNTLANAVNGISNGSETLANVTATVVNATTVDTTNIEVTNIKAKDGSASATIADSTGVFTHSTVTVFPAGSNTAPAITTTGDTNTGIFFPAADTIAFAEGGTEAMRIDSDKRISFGTQGTSSDRLIDASFLGATLAAGANQFGLVLNPTYPNTVTTNVFNFYASANIASGATLTNVFGVYVEAINASGSTVTNRYGIYQVGANDENVFAGNVKVNNGLTFPATQVASADVNTLDDYEEGIWTPTIVRENTALGAVTYTTQDGKYTKIGRVVYITCLVTWSNIASAGSGPNRIDGLPFSAGISQSNGGAFFYTSDGVATNPVLAGLFFNNTVYLRKSANILAVTNLDEAFNNSGSFAFTGYYFV